VQLSVPVLRFGSSALRVLPDPVGVGASKLVARAALRVSGEQRAMAERNMRRVLGVDAAPAVTGFGGPSRARRPVVDGVVVLAEHAAAVAAAAAEADARREDVAEAKARAVAEAGWRRLLSAALARVRLGNEHGAGGTAPSGAAARRSSSASTRSPATEAIACRCSSIQSCVCASS
jgi:hypothetical protein